MLLYHKRFLVRPPDAPLLRPLETSPLGVKQCPSSITLQGAADSGLGLFFSASFCEGQEHADQL